MKKCARITGIIFGVMMISLSFLITVETIIRKLFSISMGGVDELSGYAIAIGALLALVVTSVEQAHIRINLLYLKLPKVPQALLNFVSSISIAALALFFLYFTFGTVMDTWTYRSIAQTPWATPLIYPQAFWLAATIFFALITFILAIKAVVKLVQRDWDCLSTQFGPERVEDELAAELQDLERR